MPRGVYEREPRRNMTEDSVATEGSLRSQETRRERRRRDDGDLDRTARMKLAIPKEIQAQADREGKVLRWVRDDPGRMQQMISEDWDKVPNIDSVAASRTDDGQMVLMSKYADWYHGDRKPLEERNKALQQSALTPGRGQEGVSAEGFYQPQGTVNRIS